MRIDHMISVLLLINALYRSCILIVSCLFWSKTMKFLLLIFVVAAVLLPLQAVSLHKTWYKLAPSAKLVKSPNDIWSNCSECRFFHSAERCYCTVFLVIFSASSLQLFLCRQIWRPCKDCQCGYHPRPTCEGTAYYSPGNLQFKYVLAAFTFLNTS